MIKPASQLLLFVLCLVAGGFCGCSLIGPLVGAAAPYAGLKLMFACIPEHTRLDTHAGPRPIEELRAGDSVTGYAGEPVRLMQKHEYLESPETVFLHLTFCDGATVELCGMHRLAGVHSRDIRVGQSIAGRKVLAVDERRGATRSYDLLTEYSGYRIEGIPVNSMIEEMNAAAVLKRSKNVGSPKAKHIP